MESKTISFLEKIIEFETYFYSKIYTERVQKWLILLPITFLITSIAYQFLSFPTDSNALVIMATSLFFMFVPFITHRKSPFILFSSTFVTFATYILFYFVRATYSSNDPRALSVFFAGVIPVISWVPIPLDPCTIRYHFTDIFPLSFITSGKRKKLEPSELFTFLWLLLTVMHIFCLTIQNLLFTFPLIITTTGLCLFLCANIFREILHAQKQTRLRFDPTSENDKYDTIPYNTNAQGQGIVRILNSSTYEITLKNIGDRDWYSKGYSVCRKPSNCSCAFSRPLPYFILKPMETVVLVPEYYKFDGPCIRIEGVYCFSMKDISEEVDTHLSVVVTRNDETSSHRTETRVDFYKRLDDASLDPEHNASLETICPV